MPEGLSPRVRGNRTRYSRRWTRSGSIPARAGEPFVFTGLISDLKVYPRACGGTRMQTSSPAPPCRLSPRVRGNPRVPSVHFPAGSSIPARAGEPPGRLDIVEYSVVYPRACGGTREAPLAFVHAAGLSPRVRGNPPSTTWTTFSSRSIPARAGEPRERRRDSSSHRVYPRACGGTPATPCRMRRRRGLSPRVRGNPYCIKELMEMGGSIPARAGEPLLHKGTDGDGGVYPRACGGTEVVPRPNPLR